MVEVEGYWLREGDVTHGVKWEVDFGDNSGDGPTGEMVVHGNDDGRAGGGVMAVTVALHGGL